MYLRPSSNYGIATIGNRSSSKWEQGVLETDLCLAWLLGVRVSIFPIRSLKLGSVPLICGCASFYLVKPCGVMPGQISIS